MGFKHTGSQHAAPYVYSLQRNFINRSTLTQLLPVSVSLLFMIMQVVALNGVQVSNMQHLVSLAYAP
jgi:hypothetical protein